MVALSAFLFSGRAARVFGPFAEARLEARWDETMRSALSPQPDAASVTADPIRRACLAHASLVAQQDGGHPFSGPLSRGSALEVDVLRGGAYLYCLMTAEPKRFCAKTEREHLVETLADHLALMAKTRTARQTMVGNARFMAVHDQIFGPQDASVSRPSQALDSQLIQRLRDLAARGYIERPDFGRGWFGTAVPSEIDAALQGIASIKNACRT